MTFCWCPATRPQRYVFYALDRTGGTDPGLNDMSPFKEKINTFRGWSFPNWHKQNQVPLLEVLTKNGERSKASFIFMQGLNHVKPRHDNQSNVGMFFLVMFWVPQNVEKKRYPEPNQSTSLSTRCSHPVRHRLICRDWRSKLWYIET